MSILDWKTIFSHWTTFLDINNKPQLFGWKQFETKVSHSQTDPVINLTKIVTQILPNIHPRYLRQKLYLSVLKSNNFNLNTKTILIHTIHKLKLFLNYNLNNTNRTWNTTKITTLLKKLWPFILLRFANNGTCTKQSVLIRFV